MSMCRNGSGYFFSQCAMLDATTVATWCEELEDFDPKFDTILSLPRRTRDGGLDGFLHDREHGRQPELRVPQ